MTKRAKRGVSVDATVVRVGKADSAVHSLLAALETSKEEADKEWIPPPYNFDTLIQYWEFSSSLRPNVDAYITNIDSFGHRFEPVIDLDDADADDKIREAMHFERYSEEDFPSEANLDPDDPQKHKPTPTPPEPRDEGIDDDDWPKAADIKARKKQLRRLAIRELGQLKNFFAGCCSRKSFVELRREERQDLEITGNAFWEVLRNKIQKPAKLIRAPVNSMRLTKLDATPTKVSEAVRVSEFTWRTVDQHRYFRRFVQIDKNAIVAYFKEFGDPRVISRRTGKAYADLKELQKKEPEALEATEILHFKIPHPSLAYGVPRWIGNVTAVLGSRELDEANLDYMQRSNIPPLAILVSGGRLGRSVVPRIESFFEDTLAAKGRRHSRVLVLEAMGQGPASVASSVVPRIQFVPLRQAQQQDAVFTTYDRENRNKISSSFRLPQLLIGLDRTINRATAWASLRYAEDQVFNPERELFDETMNRTVLTDLGVVFWRLQSNAPVTRDPEILADMIEGLVTAGVLIPEEGRELAAEVFNRGFKRIRDPWTQKPTAITLAELRSGMAEQMFMNNGQRPKRTAPVPTNQQGTGQPPPGPDGGTTMTLDDVKGMESGSGSGSDE